MVLIRKIGVSITVEEELIPSPSPPAKYKAQINIEISKIGVTQQNYETTFLLSKYLEHHVVYVCTFI